MTRTDGSSGFGSEDKRDKWHMHMTRTDGSMGCGSEDKEDKWHMPMTRTDVGNIDNWVISKRAKSTYL